MKSVLKKLIKCYIHYVTKDKVGVIYTTGIQTSAFILVTQNSTSLFIQYADVEVHCY